MLTRVQKWGNSQGLRFAKHILNEARIEVGDEVEVIVEAGAIIVKPAGRMRGKYHLKELVANMPEEYRPGEEDWGTPVGNEVW
jgi:antitoxin MazE